MHTLLVIQVEIPHCFTKYKPRLVTQDIVKKLKSSNDLQIGQANCPSIKLTVTSKSQGELTQLQSYKRK